LASRGSKSRIENGLSEIHCSVLVKRSLELTLRVFKSGLIELPLLRGPNLTEFAGYSTRLTSKIDSPPGGNTEALTALWSRKCDVPRTPFFRRTPVRMLIRSNVPCHETPGQENCLWQGFRPGPIPTQPTHHLSRQFPGYSMAHCLGASASSSSPSLD